jgi:hypothetical protein
MPNWTFVKSAPGRDEVLHFGLGHASTTFCDLKNEEKNINFMFLAA